MKDWPAGYRPPERATSAIWAQCRTEDCRHVWPVCFLPMNMLDFGQLAQVRCPGCAKTGATLADPPEAKEISMKPTIGRIVHLFSNLPQHGQGPTANDPLAQRPITLAAIVTDVDLSGEIVLLTAFQAGGDTFPLGPVMHGEGSHPDYWWDWPARGS